MIAHVFPCQRCGLLPADPNDTNPRHRAGVCPCRPTQLQAARLTAEARRRFERRWVRNDWWNAA